MDGVLIRTLEKKKKPQRKFESKKVKNGIYIAPTHQYRNNLSGSKF